MQTKFLSEESLISQFKKMHPNCSYTHGSYKIDSHCNIQDLEWNQMDQLHRPFIHSTYLDSVRLVTSEQSQLSLSQLSLFGLPLYVLVTDFKLKTGYYVQSFTLFNLFYIHAVTRCTDKEHIGEWYVFSHRFLKPLQKLISLKMKKMNEKQNPEDVPVRQKRTALRKLGYRFKNDDNLNFITTNSMEDNVIYPAAAGSKKLVFSLADLQSGVRHIREDWVDLHIKKSANSSGEYLIWHGVCPHEGGPLRGDSFCEEFAVCQWHGLKFKPVKVATDGRPHVIHNYNVRLDQDLNLIVEN